MRSVNINKKQCGGRIRLLKWPGLGKISRLSDWNRELMPQVFVLRLRLPLANDCVSKSPRWYGSPTELHIQPKRWGSQTKWHQRYGRQLLVATISNGAVRLMKQRIIECLLRR